MDWFIIGFSFGLLVGSMGMMICMRWLYNPLIKKHKEEMKS